MIRVVGSGLALLLAALAVLVPGCQDGGMDRPQALTGRWVAWLDSPGGPLPFGLDLEHTEGQWRAWLVNGPERIAVPRTVVDGASVLIDIEHYDARLRATLDADAPRLDGEWAKRRGPERWGRLPFHALLADGHVPIPLSVQPAGPTDPTLAAAFTGRWAVRFESSDDPAVGVFAASEAGRLDGTFLTTTGDYRFLAGRLDDAGDLLLSCFDGAHAFLFRARCRDDGSLAGDFWSGDAWHETWSATRDADARLPDGFDQTAWTDAVPLSSLRFPDLDGRLRALDDAAFAGRARIIQVFGSWCPNCHDATEYMVELDRRYREAGLSILGLAFEVTGDLARDSEQVRRYRERHGVSYPTLVAGLSDKAAAGQSLPVLDRVRSYPTTIFMRADGAVAAVYTGFSGPATGPAHDVLRERFERIIEELLAGAPADR